LDRNTLNAHLLL